MGEAFRHWGLKATRSETAEAHARSPTHRRPRRRLRPNRTAGITPTNRAALGVRTRLEFGGPTTSRTSTPMRRRCRAVSLGSTSAAQAGSSLPLKPAGELAVCTVRVSRARCTLPSKSPRGGSQDGRQADRRSDQAARRSGAGRVRSDRPRPCLVANRQASRAATAPDAAQRPLRSSAHSIDSLARRGTQCGTSPRPTHPSSSRSPRLRDRRPARHTRTTEGPTPKPPGGASLTPRLRLSALIRR